MANKGTYRIEIVMIGAKNKRDRWVPSKKNIYNLEQTRESKISSS